VFQFNAANYGRGFQFDPPLDQYPPNPLGPGEPYRPLRATLDALTVERAFAGAKVVDHAAAQACLAGVWLRFDFLDQSHQLSQEIETTTGSYWHGLMHRREPDYGNAKYWFRRFGQHPVFEPLWEVAQQMAKANSDDAVRGILGWNRWDPFRFVDLCQMAAREGGAREQFCRELALREWELLFDYSYRTAIGEGE